MSYCPNCGRQILDESLGCPVCNVKQNTTGAMGEQAEVVSTFTVEDSNGTNQRFETPPSEARSWGDYQTPPNPGPTPQPNPVQEQDVPVALKVLIIVAIIFTSGIGAIAGLIGGIILSKSPIENYRKFGKTIIIVSSVMLALSLLCCVLGGVLEIGTFMGGYYY